MENTANQNTGNLLHGQGAPKPMSDCPGQVEI